MLFNIVILQKADSQNADFLYYPTTNFSRETYGGGNQSWDITQNKNGWIYIANNNGLLEYDGSRWRTFSVANESVIRSVYASNDNRIYAGASKEFGYFEYEEDGNLKYHSLIPKVPQSVDKIGIIWNIYQIGDIICFVSGKQDIYMYIDGEINILNLHEDIIYSQVINKYLYVATSCGIYIYRDNKFVLLRNTAAITNSRISGIIKLDQDRLLIATDSKGFYTYQDDKLEKWKTDNDKFFSDNIIYCIASSDNYIAIGTIKSGVVLMNKKGETIYKIDRKSGLQNNTVLSAFFDRDQSLWLGLDKGIDLAYTTSPITDLYVGDNFIGAGYCSIIFDDILYLGTNQGLYYEKCPIDFNRNRKITHVEKLSGQVWNLQQIDNELFCSHQDGLFIVKENSIKRIGDIQGVWKVIQVDPDKLIAGTYFGLYLLSRENKEWKVVSKIKGFEESCRVMEWDIDGSLWMAHGNIGIYRFYFNPSYESIINQQFYSTKEGFPSNINNSLCRIDNQVAFNTQDGIYRYNRSNNRMVQYRPVNMGDINQKFNLLASEDDNGYWYTADFAAGYHSKRGDMEKNMFGFFRNKLIGGFQHTQIIDNGISIFSTEDGFSYININKISSDKRVVETTIKKVKTIFNVDSILYWNNSGISEAELILPYKFNSFKIEWCTPIYEPFNQIEYSYILEGSIHHDWSKWSNKSEIDLTNLPNGDYTFRILTRNAFLDNFKEKTLKIRILPPWYLSKIAILFYYLLTILSLIMMILKIKNIIKKNTHRIEEKSKHEIAKRDRKIVALKEEQLANELMMKNQELSNSIMNVIRKNEILIKIKESVASIYTLNSQKENSMVSRKLLELQNIIASNISYDNDWEKFEKNFDMANSDYLKHLTSKFTSLSIQEKKLCVFLKMGLTTKEIAPLLNISDRGVEISRYRLRKKMMLSRNECLTEFLQNIENSFRE